MRIEGERSLRILTGLIEFRSPGILEKNRARTEDNREMPERMIIMEALKMLPLVALEWNLESTTSILMLNECHHLSSDRCRVYR